MIQKAKGGKKGRKIGRNSRRPGRAKRVSARPDLMRKAMNVAKSALPGGREAVQAEVNRWLKFTIEHKRVPQDMQQAQRSSAYRAVARVERMLEAKGI